LNFSPLGLGNAKWSESRRSNEQIFCNYCALRQHNTNGCNDNNNRVSSRSNNINNNDDDNNSDSSDNHNNNNNSKAVLRVYMLGLFGVDWVRMQHTLVGWPKLAIFFFFFFFFRAWGTWWCSVGMASMTWQL